LFAVVFESLENGAGVAREAVTQPLGVDQSRWEEV
jgi:hypothetical protein